MKLLNAPTPTKETMAAVASCIAHRCQNHKDVPPMNMAEGNGSSECGACAAEEFGARLAEQALYLQDQSVIFPLLDAYADRLTHHAMVIKMLQKVRNTMVFAGLPYADIDELLDIGVGD